MKWFLIVMLFNGAITTVPMDSQRACIDAKFKLDSVLTLRGSAVCISQE